MAKETAEQKLLKLIEATQAKDGAPPAAPKPPAPSHASAAPSPEAKRMLEAVQGGGGGGFSTGSMPASMPEGVKIVFENLRNPVLALRSPQTYGLSELNKLFTVVIIFLTVYLVVDFAGGMRSSRRGLSRLIGDQDFSENIQEFVGNMVGTYTDIAEYAKIVAPRNIFQPYDEKIKELAEEAKVEAQVATQDQIAEKLANYRLVGVSWLNSQDSVTVMIEDKSTQVTHFLRQGEELQGVKVETIYADGVLMSYSGQTLTLRL